MRKSIVNQIRLLDWRNRYFDLIGQVSSAELAQVSLRATILISG